MPPTIATLPMRAHWWMPVMPPMLARGSMVTWPLMPVWLAITTSSMRVTLWPRWT